jgi:mannitol/fructose-specific phosphotransferase system IIA component (Ntr-type)
MRSLEATTSVVPAPSLADFTQPGLIVPFLQGHDTPAIVGELSQALHREGAVPDSLAFYHAALNQELLSPSALDCGIALPHARVAGVQHVSFALGRTPEPLLWSTQGHQRVQLCFLLAVPATESTAYLHVLGSLARLGQHETALLELRRAASVQQILHILRQFQVRSTRR